jgi:hypothetical protein
MIASDTVVALYVFRVIWNRQQPIEKYTRRYAGSDGGRGFQEIETYSLNCLHDALEDQRYKPTEWQADALKTHTPKYAWQYVTDCREKGLDPIRRLPRRPGSMPQAGQAKLETQAKQRSGYRQHLSDEERQRMLANVNAMADRLGV